MASSYAWGWRKIGLSTGAVVWAAGTAAGQERPDIAWMSGGTGAEVMAVSPDGQTIVTSNRLTESALKMWRIDGTFVQTMAEGFTAYTDAVFSPDGQYVLAGRDGLPGDTAATASIWRVSDGKAVMKLNGGFDNNLDNVEDVAWSPDGRLVAVAYNWRRGIELYDAQSGGMVRTIPGGGWFAEFSTDGRFIAGSGEEGVTVWLVADGSVAAGVPTGGTVAAFSADGLYMALAAAPEYNSAVRVYRTADWSLARTIQPATVQYPHDIAFSPADPGLLVIAGSRDAAAPLEHYFSDSAIDAYRLDGSLEWSYYHAYGIAFSAAFTPDGRDLMVAGGWATPKDPYYYVEGGDDSIQRLRASDGAEMDHFAGYRGVALGVDFSPDSRLFACGGTTLQVRRVSDGQILRTFDHGANSVEFSADGRELMSAGGPVRFYSVADWGLIKSIGGELGIGVAAMSADGALVAGSGADGTVKLLRVSDGALLWSRPSEAGAVESVAISPDGLVVAGGCAGSTVRLWRASDGVLIRSLVGINPVDSVAFSPDGSTVAVGEQAYGNNLKLYRVADGSLVREFAGSQGSEHQSVTFTPDGEMILFSSGADHIQFWRIADGKLMKQYTKEVGTGLFPWMPVAASPDGRYFGYGRQDHTVVMAHNPFGPPPCYADLTGDGVLDLFDFLGYVNLFNDGEAGADCDGGGGLDLFDFLCFVNAFNLGC